VRPGFRYAPIGGRAFQREIPKALRVDLPDSVLVKRSTGMVLVRSQALLFAARRIGGAWRLLAAVGGLVPPWILDLGYDAVAGLRRKFFRRPETTCPILPAEVRARFED
jgi:predicted DCC family thiol-disulfide oxidoreductase YuxK